MDEQQQDPSRTSYRRIVLVVAPLAAIALVAVLVLVTRSASGAADVPAAAASRSTSSSTSSSSTSPSAATRPSTPPAPAPTTAPTVDADPAALADLDAVAATLTTRIALTSPASWDQWLPGGKPYPGADTADDLSTCPVLSARLGASLGTKMSYWTGTLPMGPVGCTWATVPLKSGPDAPNYPYLASVGFLDDGTTTEKLSHGFYHHQGRLCPSVAVPAVGDGAYLVRCDEPADIGYTLLTRDTRTPGIWVLSGDARSDAAHPALDVLRPVLDGVVHAYG